MFGDAQLSLPLVGSVLREELSPSSGGKLAFPRRARVCMPHCHNSPAPGPSRLLWAPGQVNLRLPSFHWP